jgi:hypothetical protein
MGKPKYGIDERLMAAQVAIDNTLNDEGVLDAVSVFGYDREKLIAARKLHDEARELVSKQKVEYGEQYEATETVRAAWDEANAAYMRALKVARIALRGNTKADAALGLSGKRKQSITGWIGQATNFYLNLLGDAGLIAALANFGYDRAKLEAEQASVQVVVEANAVQEKEKGEAQEATRLRDARLDELDQWLSDFKAIAQLAMDEHPQWLEKLGFGAVP